jgi:hypothetical protein
VRELGRFKQALAAAEPLPGTLRARWLAVSGMPYPAPLAASLSEGSHRRASPVRAIAALALLALVPPAGLTLWWLRHSRPAPSVSAAGGPPPVLATAVRPRHEGRVSEIIVETYDANAELVRLETLLVRLQAEMAQVTGAAERRAVEEQIARVLEQERRWLAALRPKHDEE